jgi:hypothetical protein
MEKMEVSVRQNLVNDFADYLCNLISENNTHSEVISPSKISSEFVESVKNKYPYLKYISTIDVISYSCDEKDFEDEVISYSTKEVPQINSELSISVSSKFPHGYSENYLKQTYNHLKEISCKSQPYFKFSWVELTCKLTKTDFEITSIKSDSYYTSEKLLSILKDNYDGPIDVLLDESRLLLNLF